MMKLVNTWSVSGSTAGMPVIGLPLRQQDHGVSSRGPLSKPF
jgi:hypothetical protein